MAKKKEIREGKKIQRRIALLGSKVSNLFEKYERCQDFVFKILQITYELYMYPNEHVSVVIGLRFGVIA